MVSGACYEGACCPEQGAPSSPQPLAPSPVAPGTLLEAAPQAFLSKPNITNSEWQTQPNNPKSVLAHHQKHSQIIPYAWQVREIPQG